MASMAAAISPASLSHRTTVLTMSDLPDPSGLSDQQISDLTAAFYRRVRTDDLIGPMYPDDDWSGAEQRLRDFLIFRFGGSDKYIQERGHPRLRMRHAPFKIGIAERDRWLELMYAAIEETKVPGDQVLNLRTFFQQVAAFLRNA